MTPKKWTDDQLHIIYSLRQKGESYAAIGQAVGKTGGSVERKYKRVNWGVFLGNAEETEDEVSGKWNQAEMGQLYAFLSLDHSYEDIAKELGRGYTSIERKAQKTDWEAWKAAVGESTGGEEVPEESDEMMLAAQLVDALVVLSRHDHERLMQIDEQEFRRKINFEKGALPIPFTNMRKQALAKFESAGLGNSTEQDFGSGTYIVVGDSHGKFTRTAMFNLLENVNKHVKAKRIFHVGHLLDDDNDISYNWGKFSNLTIVAKSEELRTIQDQRNKHNFKFEILRGCASLGNELTIMNQDLQQDYVKTSINTLDQTIFDDKVIFNSHRRELTSKTKYNGHAYFATPGALCERHIIKTIKQIDFENSKSVKVAYSDSFIKYRRMKQMMKYWDQGLLIVHVNKEGEETVIPCTIKAHKKEYVTSYMDKIITSSGICDPDEKIIVVGDIHCPYHDTNALDIQEQISKMYKPDILVNVGDTHDYKSINHHDMSKGNVVTLDLLQESATTHNVCKRMATWANRSYIIYGNHDRFAQDFIAKFPQFRNLIDLRVICNLADLGYDIIELQDVLKIGPTNFIHGDLRQYGQSGSPHEKTSKTFGPDTFFGHIHYNGIRFNTMSVGLTGKLDQGYNETNASRWVHGLGLCNHYKGMSFPTVLTIENDKCIIGKKTFTPKSPENWVTDGYSAKIIYS